MYSLRHAAAPLVLLAGLNAKVISAVLGYACVSLTLVASTMSLSLEDTVARPSP
jgi:site-specific recombinase XerD